MAMAIFPNCTVLERKHRTFRYYANNMKRLKFLDSSVIRDLTVTHIHSLNTCDKYVGDAYLIAEKPIKNKC